MSLSLHIQTTLAAPPGRVFSALTDPGQLTEWFCEFADVSLPDRRYDFWGRFTPEAPDRQAGRHELVHAEPDRALKFKWHLFNTDSLVEIFLQPDGDGTRIVARQHGRTYEDFWFLTLENLRRHLDGKTRPVRCDFSAILPGDIHHRVEIDAPPASVFGLLLDPAQLERWIASRASVDPVVGGVYDLGWPGVGPLKILEVDAGRRLALLWPDEDGDTIVTWTLEDSDGRTQLTLVHSGFAPTRNTGDLYAGWLNFASWIKSMAEYGPGWATPIIRLRPDQYAYYPATIGARQSEIRWVGLRPASTPLGNYCEIQTAVPDKEAARKFYLALGFSALDEDRLTDGNINLRLVSGAGPATLAYRGPEAEYFTDPSGLRVTVSDLPETDLAGAGSLAGPPLARCGKFGELALPCADVPGTAAFWQQFGFKVVLLEARPAPWAILSDGNVILGLHQTRDFDQPHLTYFAPDMAERIDRLTRQGIAVRNTEPHREPITNGVTVAPGGQRLFLFQGEL